MNNGIQKTGIFKLKSEPYLKPISDLGIGFYNLDENTATLRFNIFNTKGPLLLGDENLKVYGYFESRNGSVSGVIDLNIVDGMKGIVEVTLDKKFLQASTDSIVDGQLYIGVNNIDNKSEYNEVAVLGEFTFEVADALINKVSSFTKIEYIRMFDKLKEQIQQRVYDIEQAIANGADYVAEMKTTLANGKAELNNIVTDGINDIKNLVEQYKKDVLNLKNTAETNIEKVSTDSIKQMRDETESIIDGVNESTAETINHVNNKIEEFNGIVEENGLLNQEELNNELKELKWQKYELTNEDGTLRTLNVNNKMDELHALKPGQYYLSGVAGLPQGVSQIGIANVSWRQDGNIKCITYIPYNSSIQFIKRLSGSWSNWEQMNYKPSDTGWLPITWLNGAKQSTITEFTSGYRVLESDGVKRVYLKLSAVNVTSNQVLASIPQEITGGEDHYGVATSTIAKVPLKIKISSDGSIAMYKYTTDTWETNSYIVVEMNWII
ncbi:BppU family phage baseplate upper protein [Mammaliicoccus lentus]|uniref:BppU family phage baseplate upper protein n=1 Tax=Mammaliicoccus lentus TaxID=42858 RepID=UPI0011C8AC3A|nr:BppU family phage baseplate upper protein [Mammaliicoccus lentus]